MAATASNKVGKVIGKPKYYDGVFHAVNVRIAGAAINFSIAKSKSANAAHTLRIELNPAELGSDGALTLMDSLHAATGKAFRVGAFLASARVSKVDIAIDLVGVHVRDLLVSAKGEGKRVHYYGQDGELESVYVHKKFKPHDPEQLEPDQAVTRKGLGMLLVRAYDKVAERKSVGKKPPFGPSPVTRVEVSKTRFGNTQAKLKNLPKLKNPLEKIAAAHVRSTKGVNAWDWLGYVQARRGGGPALAGYLLQISAKTQAEFEARYTSFEEPLWHADEVWKLWSASLVAHGVGHFIDAADAESSGSVIGDFELAMAKKTGQGAP